MLITANNQVSRQKMKHRILLLRAEYFFEFLHSIPTLIPRQEKFYERFYGKKSYLNRRRKFLSKWNMLSDEFPLK